MARMTNAQLVDENIRLRAQCEVLEAKIRELSDKLLANTKEVERLVTYYEAQSAQRPASRTPLHVISALARKEAARRYFAANPEARSVTDAELREFCAH